MSRRALRLRETIRTTARASSTSRPQLGNCSQHAAQRPSPPTAGACTITGSCPRLASASSIARASEQACAGRRR